MLLETDAPYMAPVPFRGKPCHSGYIPFIADKLAEIKNVTVEELYHHCRENTKKCYGI
jgi:TatD DNase family protein